LAAICEDYELYSSYFSEKKRVIQRITISDQEPVASVPVVTTQPQWHVGTSQRKIGKGQDFCTNAPYDDTQYTERDVQIPSKILHLHLVQDSRTLVSNPTLIPDVIKSAEPIRHQATATFISFTNDYFPILAILKLAAIAGYIPQ